MTVTVVAPNAAGLEPQKNIWEAFDWSAEQQRAIHRSWGQYFSKQRLNASAQKYFDMCINENHGLDYTALYLRSQFHRSVARADLALEDSRLAATVSGPCDAEIRIELADALYDLNRFEDVKVVLHENLRKYVGSAMEPFEKRLDVVNENFKDSLGNSLGPFFLKNSDKLPLLNEIMRKTEDTRPRWKILKELAECDVLSVMDKEEEMQSPLEAARRKRKTKIFYQNYLNRAWTDIFFLKTLRKNPNLLLEQCSSMSKERSEYLNATYARVKTFTQMLHARSPMYNEIYQRRRNSLIEAKFRESNLFRVQYQTRRNMLSILRTIRVLRNHGEGKRLRNFVEEVMGEYVVVKTNRIMPWKIEFMNEVYNHLALSLCEGYRLPTAKITPYDKNALLLLLNMPASKHADHQEFVFGDRSTHATGNLLSPKQLGQKRIISHLEKRLFFATQPIERAYLLHELADRHVHQNHFVQCLSYAKKAIDEARSCNSKIWEFLGTILQAKSHAVLHKYERQTEVLDSAYNLAKELKSPRLCTFIELCRMLNKDYMTLRKMSQLEAGRKLRSKVSNRSSRFNSPLPSQSDDASLNDRDIPPDL